MARTAITVTKLTRDGNIAQPTPTNIDAANGMYIAAPGGGVPADDSVGSIILIVTNTFAGSKTVTVKAGANPPAHRQGLGDLAQAMAQDDVRVLGPFDPARFLQADGTMNIDFTASMTGTVAAYKVSRRS